MNEDSERWDKIHKKTSKLNDGHSAYAEEKEKLFPRGALVCDLGGGTGADVVYFLRQGHSVILLDISQVALDMAKKKAEKEGLSERLAVYQTDFGLHQLPLKDNSIDVAYSHISLHYFPFDETRQIFLDIYRALKPQGKAFLTFKSGEDKKEMEYLENSTTLYEPNVFIENGQLRSRFTVEQLVEMGQKAGISSYQAYPYKEEIVDARTGHTQVLLQNEVVFVKG